MLSSYLHLLKLFSYLPDRSSLVLLTQECKLSGETRKYNLVSLFGFSSTMFTFLNIFSMITLISTASPTMEKDEHQNIDIVNTNQISLVPKWTTVKGHLSISVKQ